MSTMEDQLTFKKPYHTMRANTLIN